MFKFLFFSGVLAGCAGAPVLTEQQSENLDPDYKIISVPFVSQKIRHCGPATLTMLSRWAGRSVEESEIAEWIYTPKAKGSFQTDLLSAGRRLGLMAVPIHGEKALFEELDQGHPVIVFQNLAFRWWTQWHYAVVVGHSLNQKEIILHSGPDAFLRNKISEFQRTWKLAGEWGLVILPAGQISISASELENLQAAVALEEQGFHEEALKSYQSILKKWPRSLGALMGLANIHLFQKDYGQSKYYLKQAIRFHPESPWPKQNLKYLSLTSNEK